MRNKQFNRYYLFVCIGVLAAAVYPLSMGVRVLADMLRDGLVLKENYPKYIIPYTPISIAVLAGVALMPIFLRLFRKYALAGGAAVSTALFFGLEWFFERNVLVTTGETVTVLQDWQMFMCYTPPGGWGEVTHKTKTAVEILMGEYSPAFKLHFYMISVVLILTILNALYGFGQMVLTGDGKRKKGLLLQSVSAALFLGLCVLACFTAFWRDGSLQVSALSAFLMILFFILLGVTAGSFAGSFLLEKGNFPAVWVPAMVASAMTLLMYMGEMILLSGHVYSFGTGFLFGGLPGIVLAPIDLLTIAASGCITALLFKLHRR